MSIRTLVFNHCAIAQSFGAGFFFGNDFAARHNVPSDEDKEMEFDRNRGYGIQQIQYESACTWWIIRTYEPQLFESYSAG